MLHQQLRVTCVPAVNSNRRVGVLIVRASSTNTVSPATNTPPVLTVPKPIPVIHSPAYLQQQLATGSFAEEAPPSSSMTSSTATTTSGNAFEDLLHKLDDNLKDIEQNPSEIQKTIYDLANGPAGQAASKGISTAARVAVDATAYAAKVAAPVGQWALKEGGALAMKLAMEAMAKVKEADKNKNR